MTESMHGSLVGLPEKIDSARVHELRQQLTDLWQLTMGRSPGGLEADLELSRKWFDPVAQGERLRRELSALPTVPKGASELASPWTYHVGENKWLVTPEGRCVLDLLEALPIAPIHLISDDLLVPYDRLLGRTYQRWGRHRLESVVGLLRGSDKPLQIPAAAVVIALLVNRCTSEERALVRFAAGPARDVVDGAFFAPVKAFHETLVPKQVSARAHPRLISGWMLYEARRRLGDGLVLTDARRPRDGRVWIRPDQIDVIIGRLARDLMRGHRVRATPETLGRAFDALVDALRLELPKLAGYGLVHERPPETRRLRQRLIDSLSDGDLNGS